MIARIPKRSNQISTYAGLQCFKVGTKSRQDPKVLETRDFGYFGFLKSSRTLNIKPIHSPVHPLLFLRVMSFVW